MSIGLTERLASALSSIEAAQQNNAVSAETKELLTDLRMLLLDIDHARRHYRRATKLAAVEFAKLGRGARVD